MIKTQYKSNVRWAKAYFNKRLESQSPQPRQGNKFEDADSSPEPMRPLTKQDFTETKRFRQTPLGSWSRKQPEPLKRHSVNVTLESSKQFEDDCRNSVDRLTMREWDFPAF